MNSRNLLVLGVGIVFSFACSHKPPATTSVEAPPAVDSEPMSFASEGSDSGKIDGLYSIHFNYDNASLDAESKNNLVKNATWLNAHPKAKMQIEGHCDQRGTIEYNLALGEKRARSAMDYLLGLGVSKERMTVISYGKEKPLAKGDTDRDYAQNRRANFVPIK